MSCSDYMPYGQCDWCELATRGAPRERSGHLSKNAGHCSDYMPYGQCDWRGWCEQESRLSGWGGGLQQMHRLQRSGVCDSANLLAPGLGDKSVWRTPLSRSPCEDNRSAYPTQEKFPSNKTNLKQFFYFSVHEQLTG